MHPKRKTIYLILASIISVTFLLLFFLDYIRLPLGKMTGTLLHPLAEYISTQMGCTITVGEIQTNFINRIYVNNLTVYVGTTTANIPLFFTRNLNLEISVLQLLPRFKKPDDAIRKIILKNPVINLTNQTGTWNLPEMKITQFHLPNIIIHNGILKIYDRTAKFPPELKQIYGRIINRKEKYNFHFSALPPDENKSMLVDGILAVAKNEFNFKLKLKKFAGSLFNNYLISRKIKVTAGTINLDLNVAGNKFALSQMSNWLITGTGQVVDWQMDYNPTTINTLRPLTPPLTRCTGSFTVRNNKINTLLTGQIVNSPFKLNGYFLNYFTQPEFKFEFSCPQLDSKSITHLFKPDIATLMDGKFNVTLILSGSVDKYFISGNLFTKTFKFRTWNLTDFYLKFIPPTTGTTKQQETNLPLPVTILSGQGQLGNGTLSIDGKLMYPNGFRASLKLRNGDLNQLNKYPLTAGLITGTGNLDLSWINQDRRNYIALNLHSREVKLAGDTQKYEFYGTLTAQPDKTSLRLVSEPERYTLIHTQVRENNRIQITESYLKIADRKIYANGTINPENNNLNITINSDEINFATIPLLTKYIGARQGNFQINGSLTGNLLNPLLNFNLTGMEKSVGEINLSLNQKMDKTNITCKLNHGTFYGLKYDQTTITYFTDVDATSAQVTCLQQNNKNIHSGKLTFRYHAIRQPNKNFTVTVTNEMDNLFWNENNFTGKFILNGTLNNLGRQNLTFTATLNSPDLMVNNLNLGIVKAKLDLRNGILSINSAEWGDKIKYTGETVFRGPQHTLQGTLTFSNLTPQETGLFISPLRTIKHTQGSINGTVLFKGTLESPQVRMELFTRKVKIQNKNLNVTGFIEYRTHTFIPKIEINWQHTLQTTITGWVRQHKSGWIYNIKSDKLNFGKLEMTNLLFTGKTEPYRWEISTGTINIFNGQINFLPGTELVFPVKTNPTEVKLMVLAQMKNLTFPGINLWGTTKLESVLVLPQPTNKNMYSGTATFSLTDFWLNQYRIDQAQQKVKYEHNKLEFIAAHPTGSGFTGILDFSQYPKVKLNEIAYREGTENIVIAAGILDPENLNFTVKGNDLPLPLLTALANLKVGSTGKVNFHVLGSGRSKSPTFNGRIDTESGKINEIPYDILSALFSYRNDTLYIKNLYAIAKDKYSFTISGEVPGSFNPPTSDITSLSTTKPVKLKFSLSKGNLDVLTNITDKIVRARGLWETEGEITGSLDDLRVKGTLNVYNGEITAQDYIKHLTGLNIELRIAEKTVFFDRAEFRSGQGKVQLTGKIGLSGFNPQNFDLTLKTSGNKGIALNLDFLAIPQSTMFKRVLSNPSSGEVKLNLNLKGVTPNPTLAGMIELANTRFTFPPPEQTEPVSLPEWLNKVYWNLELKTLENVRYENELVSAHINGSIKFVGPTDKLNVSGTLETISGNVSYLSRNFEIKTAKLDITGSDVYLEGTAETKAYVPDPRPPIVADTPQRLETTITMVIDRNKITELRPRFIAQERPDLSSEKVIVTLISPGSTDPNQIGGLKPEEIQNLLQQEIIRWIDSTLATPLAKTILNRAGIPFTFRVTRDLTADKSVDGNILTNLLVGTKYTVEQSLTDQLSIGYSGSVVRKYQVGPTDILSLRHEIGLTQRWKDFVIKGGYIFRDPNAPPNIPGEQKIEIQHIQRFGPPEE